MRQFYVYMLASHSRCLYTGVTNELRRRMFEHSNGWSAFVSKHRTFRLVYFETTTSAVSAMRREKQIKGWRRAKKVALIEKDNPFWLDLAAGWFDDRRGDPSVASLPQDDN
jgi:putative endonuclease